MIQVILGVLESFGGIIITTLVLALNSYFRAFVWKDTEMEYNSFLVFVGLFIFIAIFRYSTYLNRKKQAENVKSKV